VGARGERRRGAPSSDDVEIAAGPRAHVGDPDADREAFAAMSPLLAAEHITLVMARRRSVVAREELLSAAGDLLLSTEDADFVRRVLIILGEQTRVLDVYPLEVLAYCLERRPDLVNTHRFTPFVLNRTELASGRFVVEAPIRIALPLSATMRAMALVGGGAPGYHLYPGGPTEYLLEMGAAGTFSVLLRAEVRRESVVDRITVTVVDDQDEAPDRA
jgi:hypothetical protein